MIVPPLGHHRPDAGGAALRRWYGWINGPLSPTMSALGGKRHASAEYEAGFDPITCRDAKAPCQFQKSGLSAVGTAGFFPERGRHRLPEGGRHGDGRCRQCRRQKEIAPPHAHGSLPFMVPQASLG